MYIDDPIKKYLTDLSAKLPTPGGGSAAGLGGALGVGLLEMVCNFTVGKEKYKNVERDIQNHLASLKKVREEFSILIDEDIEIYLSIQSAFKSKDKKNIEKALKDGYYISLKICELSKRAMQIALEVSEKGNINLITDVGCGAEFLNSAFNSAIFNCKVNLKGLTDTAFIKNGGSLLDKLEKEKEILYKRAVDNTMERIG